MNVQSSCAIVDIFKLLGDFFILGFYARTAILNVFPSWTTFAALVCIVIEFVIAAFVLWLVSLVIRSIARIVEAKRNLRK